MKKILMLMLSLATTAPIWGQSTYIPRGNDAYHIMDRLEIKSGDMAPFYSLHKPYDRKDVTQYAVELDNDSLFTHKLDSADLYYIFKDNNDWLRSEVEGNQKGLKRYLKKEYIDSTQTFYQPKLVAEYDSMSFGWEKRYVKSRKPFLKLFYKTPANMLELDAKYFKLRFNPILHWKVGKETGVDGIQFQNTRGVQVRANIDDRVWFHTEIVENQARFNQHITDRIEAFQAVPGAGFYKEYKSNFIKYNDDYDYLNAQGYFAARISKHIQLKLGHGRNFIGNGERSLLLSDNSANYFYLKLNTRVWKINYQNLFIELTEQYNRGADRLLPKKYMTAHYLNFNAFKNFNIGIFEATVFDRGKAFELQYLNPVILYRTVEQAIGSSDNAFFGFNAKYNFLKRFSVYSQFILDEFKFSEFFGGTGWWANKYGLQVGLKYIDAFNINHLDLQVEYNTVRPYTYSHKEPDSISVFANANYTHYNQPLAHPLGANFKEAIAIIRYQPIHPLKIMARLVYADYGTDPDATLNYGGNIFLPSRGGSVVSVRGNKTGQGVGNKMLLGALTTSYQVRHNLYVDLDFRWRKLNSDVDTNDYTRTYIGMGIRLNASEQRLDY